MLPERLSLSRRAVWSKSASARGEFCSQDNFSLPLQPPQHQQRSPKTRLSLERLLTHLIDLGIAATFFVVPLFLAGLHAIGRLAFVTSVSMAAIAWSIRNLLSTAKRPARSGIEWIILAAALLLLIQLSFLPSNTLRVIAPNQATLLPIWSATEGTGKEFDTWNQLSLYPASTRYGASLFLTASLLFFVTLQRIDSLYDIERFLLFTIAAATFFAVLALGQFLFGNGKFLWLYEHPFRKSLGAAQGPFSNANHLAHFLAISLGPLIWLFVRIHQSAAWPHTSSTPSVLSPARQYDGPNRRRRHAIATWICLATILTTVCLSFSRGGILVSLAVAIFVLLWLVRLQLINKRVLASLTIAILSVAITLSIYGLGPLLKQFEALTTALIPDHQSFSRWTLWSADWKVFQDFPLFGTGVGTHSSVYPIHLSKNLDFEYTYAENGYLQLLIETGLVGAALFLILFGTTLYWCWTTMRQREQPRIAATGAAITASLLASALHSLWDFVWFVPACLAPTLVLLACICRLHHFAKPPARKLQPPPQGLSYPVRFAICAMICGVCFLSVRLNIGPARAALHWDHYLHLSQTGPQGAEEQQQLSYQMLTSLSQVVSCDPSHSRAHLRLASLCLQQFDAQQSVSINNMPLSQIRAAAYASEFSNLGELHNWLNRSLGKNRQWLDLAQQHAYRAACLCPLEGRCYAILSEVVFLEGGVQLDEETLLNQALQLRPRDSNILLTAGSHAASLGNLNAASEFWKQVFQSSTTDRQLLITALSGQLPPRFFLQAFQPDKAGLIDLLQHYRNINHLDGAGLCAAQLFDTVMAEILAFPAAQTAAMWMQAFSLANYLKDPAATLNCLKKAAILSPQDSRIRRLLVQELLRQGKLGEAQKHIHRQLQQNPKSKHFRALHAQLQVHRSPKQNPQHPEVVRTATAR